MAKDRDDSPKGYTTWRLSGDQRDPPTEEVARQAAEAHPSPMRRRGDTPRKLFDYMKAHEIYIVTIEEGGRVVLTRSASGAYIKLNDTIGHSDRAIRSRLRFIPPTLEGMRCRLRGNPKLMVGVAVAGTLGVFLLMLWLPFELGIFLLLTWLTSFFAFVNVRAMDVAPVLEDINRAIRVLDIAAREHSNLHFRLTEARSGGGMELRPIMKALRDGIQIALEDEDDAKDTRELHYILTLAEEEE